MAYVGTQASPDWDQHTDASGRVFLANTKTGETKWLWKKWAAQGRVFCVHSISNVRMWQDEMPLELRVAAGVNTAPPQQQNNTAIVSGARRTRENAGSYAAAVSRGIAEHQVKRQRVRKDAPFWPSERWGSHLEAHNNYQHHTGVRYTSTSGAAAAYSSPQILTGELSSQRSGYMGKHDMRHQQQQREDRRVVRHERVPRAAAGEARQSRFAPAARSAPSAGVRARPLSPNATVIKSRRRSSKFLPTSSVGKSMRKMLVHAAAGPGSSTDPCSVSRLALLFERDFPPSDTQRAKSSGHLVNPVENGTSSGALVGTCRSLEKRYLRLTSAANPSEVRPLDVLKRALKLVKKNWAKQVSDYEWVCSQLKSIRQDMKVQHIETEETLDTYETHARVALENSDFGEFNTCLAQLTELYTRVERPDSVRDEFTCYRVLYNALVGASHSEFARWLQETPEEERKRPAAVYATEVRDAYIEGNYSTFFKLYANPPSRTMVSFILDHMLDEMRSQALARMCTAYSPTTLPLSFVITELMWIQRADESNDAGSTPRLVKLGDCGEKMTGEVASWSVSIDEVLSFCDKVGVVVEPSGKVEAVPFRINAKASRSNGVAIQRERSGFITAAGAQTG